jgi:hypothetical protein
LESILEISDFVEVLFKRKVVNKPTLFSCD